MRKVPYYPLDRINAVYTASAQNIFSSVFNSGWFIRGNQNNSFEKEFADFCGEKYCIGVGNGLDALSLILKSYIALGILKKGDKVVVPANTFIATWLAVKNAGLEPYPVDVDEKSSLLTVEKLRLAWDENIKAVIVVHLYGLLADMEEFENFSKEKNFVLIEDAAQAHGASRNGRKAGSFGNASAFSFYPTKNLGALGDAGAVVTSDSKLANTVRKMGNYGSSKKYVHELAGVNSRLDEIQAAILSLKLKRLENDNHRRIEIAKIYSEKINNPFLKLPCITNTNEHVFHIFAVHTKYRNELQEHLQKLGVETLVHYPLPPHLQGAFLDCHFGEFPVAEKQSKETLSLPLFPVMEESEILQVIDAVNSFSPSL